MKHVLPILPHGPIWECAAGDGVLVRAITATGRDVVASDLFPRDVSPPLDFLDDAGPPAKMLGSVVVTNGPFNALDAFLHRGFTLLEER